MSIQFLKAKIKYILFGRNMKYIIDSLRKNGITVGDNCNVYSDIITGEPYLISIEDNVTISNDVQFITHDNSICKIIPNKTDVVGEIKVGKNCFIGARTVILPGVSLADSIIVGAGSVVTKSFIEEGIIIGGNPARKIGTIAEYRRKVFDQAINVDGLDFEEKKEYLLNNEDKHVKK